jgi:energy-coupling factor transporter ATP-binding protein EcfA2
VTDYSSYSDTRRSLSEDLTTYHYERLKRSQRAAGIEAESESEIDQLEELESQANNAASQATNRGSIAAAAELDRDEIKAAISRVNAMSYSYGSFFDKMQRKSAGREAARYLRSIVPLFAPEVERLRDEQRAQLQALDDAQARDDAAIKDAAERLQAEARALAESAGAAAQPFAHESWGESDWSAGDGLVRLTEAYHWIGDEKYEIPYLAKVPGHNVYTYSEYFPEKSSDFVNGTLLRAIRSIRPGGLRLLLIDPTSLGNVFAPLLSLSEHSEEIITTKVWTTEADIRARLEEASDRVGLILQKYLTDEYETLEEYNLAAGEIAEESVVIAINDFPRGLDQRSIEIVKSLAEVGPRCGVSLLIRQAKYEKIAKELYPVCKEISATAHRLGVWKVADYFRNWDSYRGGYNHYHPSNVDDELLDKVGSFLDLFEYENGTLSWREESYSWASGSSRGWHTEAPEDWSPDLAEGVLESVSRRFAEGARVEVHLDKVWQLFAESRIDAPPVSLDKPDSLWHESSLEELVVPVGRHGSRGVSTFRFDSQLQSGALLVGRPGSGKSNLLHVVICTLASMYSPDELELYLLDFKEAVEFAGYASGALPHARAIALESDREFGLAVLRHLANEIERRGRLFRDGGGEQSSIVTYRSNTGLQLPRILLLIDEFHRLFDREDALANEAAKYLDDIIRLGRGFGIHCLLASQTLLGMSALGRHTLNQIAIRAALQCSDEDSRIVFSEDNPAAALLARPGEAVKNTSGGRLANNEPFQVPLLPDEDRRKLLQVLEERASQDGRTTETRVYRRDIQAPWRSPTEGAGDAGVALRFGDAVAIDPDLAYELTREGGRNVLVVGRNEFLASDMLAATIADVALRHRASVELTIIDLMTVDGPVSQVAEHLGVKTERRRDLAVALTDLAREVEEREPSRNQTEPARILVLNGLGKARDLDPDDYSDEGQKLLAAVATILRDGPEVGIHTIMWADSVATVDSRLGRQEREFGARVAFRMSGDDSMRLCDSDLATQLQEKEAVLIDIDRGTTVKFQPFAAPTIDGAALPEGVESRA